MTELFDCALFYIKFTGQLNIALSIENRSTFLMHPLHAEL